MREAYLYQTVHVLDGSASACGNTWPYSTAGRARSSGARGHRTPGRSGRPSRRWPDGKPRQRPFEIRAARPAGIGLPAAGIRRRFALPRLRPAQPDARSRDAAIRTAAVRRPHLGTRGRRRAGTAIRRVAGCERRRTLRPQRDSHGGRRSGAVRHPGQAGLRPAGRSEHRAQPCSQEHPRRRAGTGRSARRARRPAAHGRTFLHRPPGRHRPFPLRRAAYMAIFAERIAGALRGLFPNM